jgi:hypothetical protein
VEKEQELKQEEEEGHYEGEVRHYEDEMGGGDGSALGSMSSY